MDFVLDFEQQVGLHLCLQWIVRLGGGPWPAMTMVTLFPYRGPSATKSSWCCAIHSSLHLFYHLSFRLLTPSFLYPFPIHITLNDTPHESPMMASFMSYFGAGRKDPKQSARDAIVGLRQQLQMIEKKEEFLQKKIEEETKKARANAVSNKACTSHSFFKVSGEAATFLDCVESIELELKYCRFFSLPFNTIVSCESSLLSYPPFDSVFWTVVL